MSMETQKTQASKVAMTAFILGICGILVAGFGFYQGLQARDVRPLMSWLIGIVFWLSIAVGMLFLTQIWYVFHARWPVIIRRQCEHFMASFPWLFLLFIPLLLVPAISDDPGIMWKWMDGGNKLPTGHGTVAADPLYESKSPYLNIPFFLLRSVCIFGVFILIAHFLRKWSFDADKTGDAGNIHRSRVLSSIGLFLCAGAATVAAIDWLKSLEYHWFSTMYGVWFFCGFRASCVELYHAFVHFFGCQGLFERHLEASASL